MTEGAWRHSHPLGITAKPWREHLDDIRFLAFGRALPAVFFGFIGYRVLRNLLDGANIVFANVTAIGVLALLPVAVYFAFCAIPVGIYLTRPRARARDGRLIARAAGLLGTTLLLWLGILGGPVLYETPVALFVVDSVFTTVAFIVAIWGLLTLRRNLSIIPEARRLVTAGPYRFVRHPLYAMEILTALALVSAHPTLWAVVGVVPFAALQLLRARFEERLLRGTFTDYDGYAARTRRLVPAVW